VSGRHRLGASWGALRLARGPKGTRAKWSKSVIWEIHNLLEVSMGLGKISNLFSVSNAHTIFVNNPNVERWGLGH